MTFKEFRYFVGRLLGIKKYLTKIIPGETLDIGKLLHGSLDLPRPALAPNDERPVVTMSNFGHNGRFGNQLFQYTFLSLVAHRQSAQLQLPVWPGSALFGLNIMLDVKVPSKLTQESKTDFSNLIKLMRVKDENFEGIDYDGQAQLHTSAYAPDKEFIRSLYIFDARLLSLLKNALIDLGLAQKKIIAIHLRRGDYGYNQYFRAPCSWYEKWLSEAGYSPDEYIIYICSESPAKYRKRFPQFTVITSDDLNCPAQLNPYIDFMVMTLADALATSNSSFSFFASMLNVKTSHFYRPDFDQSGLVSFDPWNADPLLNKTLSPAEHQYLKSID
jgi:hypothetical protein